MRSTLITASLIAALSTPSFAFAQSCFDRRDHARDLATRQECAAPAESEAGASYQGDTGACTGYQYQFCCYGRLGPFTAGFYEYVESCRFGAIDGGLCPAGKGFCCLIAYPTGNLKGYGTGYTCEQIPDAFPVP